MPDKDKDEQQKLAKRYIEGTVVIPPPPRKMVKPEASTPEEKAEPEALEASPIFAHGEAGVFSPEVPLLDLANPHLLLLTPRWNYRGPELAPEQQQLVVGQINEVLEASYRQIAAQLGFSVEKNTVSGALEFKNKNGENISTAERLQIENQLQQTCNQVAKGKGYGIQMVHNGAIAALERQLNTEAQQQWANSPMNPYRTPKLRPPGSDH